MSEFAVTQSSSCCKGVAEDFLSSPDPADQSAGHKAFIHCVNEGWNAWEVSVPSTASTSYRIVSTLVEHWNAFQEYLIQLLLNFGSFPGQLTATRHPHVFPTGLSSSLTEVTEWHSGCHSVPPKSLSWKEVSSDFQLRYECGIAASISSILPALLRWQ